MCVCVCVRACVRVWMCVGGGACVCVGACARAHFVVDTGDFRPITGAHIATKICVGSKYSWRVSGVR